MVNLLKIPKTYLSHEFRNGPINPKPLLTYIDFYQFLKIYGNLNQVAASLRFSNLKAYYGSYDLATNNFRLAVSEVKLGTGVAF